MANRPWSACLLQVPGAEYFKQLKRPPDIAYLDYVRYRRVQSADQDTCDQEWINAVLVALRTSGNQSLGQEYSRLDGAWRRGAAQHKAFRSGLHAEENKQTDEHLDAERTLFLKQNVVR